MKIVEAAPFFAFYKFKIYVCHMIVKGLTSQYSSSIYIVHDLLLREINKKINKNKYFIKNIDR